MAGAGERRFLIVAGEPSGDAHAARLVACLAARGPCAVRGVVGPALAAAGVGRVASMDALSVVGFSGVVARLPRIWRTYRRLLAEARDFRPHAAVLVDSPGFNLRLGPALKRLGVPVFYYIAPQVWAWHPERAAAMARWVDLLAVVFPFEEPLFRQAGVRAHFVGHPLLDGFAPEVSESVFRDELGIEPGTPILGLLPGSRASELGHHLRPMVEAARRLKRERPELAVVIPAAPGMPEGELRRAALRIVARSGTNATRTELGVTSLQVVGERTRAVQAYSTACAVASGTATLETALFGTPLVIVYRAGAFNYQIAKRLVSLDRIGLPNIVAQQDVAPELIQDDLTPERLAETLAPMLDDPSVRAARRERLVIVRERLGEPGASKRASALLWDLAA